MGLSVGSLSNYTYQMYELQSSDTYSEYAVDESDVSKENYNVSDVSSLLETMSNTDTVSFSSVTNAASFAKLQLTLSQLSCYDTLSTILEDDGMSDVLSNSTDLSELYASASYDSNSAAISTLLSSYASTASESYERYLSSTKTSSLLDTTV